MYVQIIDSVSREEISEIECVARAQACLRARAIFLLVLIDEFAWPFPSCAACFRLFLPDSQNFLRRRVVNRRARPGDMLVPQTAERGLTGSSRPRDSEPLERQHPRPAKAPRNDGIAARDRT